MDFQGQSLSKNTKEGSVPSHLWHFLPYASCTSLQRFAAAHRGGTGDGIAGGGWLRDTWPEPKSICFQQKGSNLLPPKMVQFSKSICFKELSQVGLSNNISAQKCFAGSETIEQQRTLTLHFTDWFKHILKGFAQKRSLIP